MANIRSFNKTLTTAGVAERVFGSSNTVIAQWIRFGTDSGRPVIGDENVVAAAGSQVGSPTSGNANERKGIFLRGPISLKNIWFDQNTDGKKITGTYLAKVE